MIPGTLNLSLYRGDSVDLIIRLRAQIAPGVPGDYIDITGVTPRAQIRASEQSSEIVASFTCIVLDQVTSTGGLNLKLSAATTSALPITAPMRWDLELLHPSGHVRTYLRGSVSVTADVTR